MHVERTGRARKLTPLFERFLVEALRGVSLDHSKNSEITRIDFSCLGGLLAIEIKSLEDDASERMNNLTEELRERDDWPAFLGSAPMASFIEHLEDPKTVEFRVFDRMGRAIKNHIHKANKQLEAHLASNPRNNTVRVIFLINEDNEIYDPKNVSFIVQKLLLREEQGALLYPNIDAVFFITERHAAVSDRQISFPIMCIEGKTVEQAIWKRDVFDLILRRLGRWSGSSIHDSEFHSVDFSTVQQVPKSMKRYEQWELDYRRNPYMREFTKEEIRERYDEMMAITMLKFVKGSPETPGDEAVKWSMSSMSHFMLEMGWRSIPITAFPQDPERLANAASRLGFGEEAITWLRSNLGQEKQD